MIVRHRNDKHHDERGFTLVELLITVVIIAILTAIAIPAYISVVAGAQNSAAQQQLVSVRSAELIQQTTKGAFGTGTQLTASAALKMPAKTLAVTDTAGSCFTSMVLSDAGTLFWVDTTHSTPTQYVTTATSNCGSLSDMATALNPALPNVSDDWGWQVNAAGAWIEGYWGASTAAVIPPSFDVGETAYPVTTVDTAVFDASDLTSVVIPDTVTTIGDNAFRGNPRLTAVTLPAKLQLIGNGAFLNSPITALTIPVGVSTIRTFAFAALASNAVVKFTGNAPASFVSAAGGGSLGNAGTKSIQFKAGTTGYTAPTWQGYASSSY